MPESGEGVLAGNDYGFMRRVEGQRWRKLRIVKATIRSVASTLQLPWYWLLSSSVAASQC